MKKHKHSVVKKKQDKTRKKQRSNGIWMEPPCTTVHGERRELGTHLSNSNGKLLEIKGAQTKADPAQNDNVSEASECHEEKYSPR